MSMIGGIASLGASLYGGTTASSAAQAAAAQQVGANNQAGQYLQNNLNDLTNTYQPWINAGSNALSQYGNLLGINGGGAQTTALNALQSSPIYDALFTNGENNILANAAASGGLRSGNLADSLSQFGANTLAQVLGQQESQLGNVSQMGLGATSGLAGATGTTGNAIANLMSQSGHTAASGTLGSAASQVAMANQIGSSLSSLANNSSVQQAMGSLFS